MEDKMVIACGISNQAIMWGRDTECLEYFVAAVQIELEVEKEGECSFPCHSNYFNTCKEKSREVSSM